MGKQPVFLLLIKATKKPNEEYLQIPQYKYKDELVELVKSIEYLLVDTDFKTILKCSNNDQDSQFLLINDFN